MKCNLSITSPSFNLHSFLIELRYCNANMLYWICFYLVVVSLYFSKFTWKKGKKKCSKINWKAWKKGGRWDAYNYHHSLFMCQLGCIFTWGFICNLLWHSFKIYVDVMDDYNLDLKVFMYIYRRNILLWRSFVWKMEEFCEGWEI